MAIVKSKPTVKKAAVVVAKKPVAATKAATKPVAKSAAANNTKLKASVKKSFDPAGLGEYQSVWAGTEPAERGEFGDIPDGKYTARIDEAILDTGKNGDRLQVKWTLTILGPEMANRKVWQNTGLMDAKGIEITKGNLKTLGIEIPEEITDLPDVLDQVKNLTVEIALITREGKNENAGKFFQNAYINKAVSEDGSVVEASESSKEDAGEGEWAGKMVSFTHEDVEYTGTVVSDNGSTAIIAVEGQVDQWELPLDMLTEVDPNAEGMDPNDFVGQYVQFESDGKTYAGDVTGVDKDGNLIVVINDEEWGVGVKDVTIVEKPKAKPAVKVAAKPAVRTIKK